MGLSDFCLPGKGQDAGPSIQRPEPLLVSGGNSTLRAQPSLCCVTAALSVKGEWVLYPEFYILAENLRSFCRGARISSPHAN